MLLFLNTILQSVARLLLKHQTAYDLWCQDMTDNTNNDTWLITPTMTHECVNPTTSYTWLMTPTTTTTTTTTNVAVLLKVLLLKSSSLKVLLLQSSSLKVLPLKSWCLITRVAIQGIMPDNKNKLLGPNKNNSSPCCARMLHKQPLFNKAIYASCLLSMSHVSYLWVMSPIYES